MELKNIYQFGKQDKTIAIGVEISRKLNFLEAKEELTSWEKNVQENLEYLFDYLNFSEEEIQEIDRIVLDGIKQENLKKCKSCSNAIWEKSFLYCEPCEQERRKRFQVDESIHSDHILIMP